MSRTAEQANAELRAAAETLPDIRVRRDSQKVVKMNHQAADRLADALGLVSLSEAQRKKLSEILGEVVQETATRLREEVRVELEIAMDPERMEMDAKLRKMRAEQAIREYDFENTITDMKRKVESLERQLKSSKELLYKREALR